MTQPVSQYPPGQPYPQQPYAPPQPTHGQQPQQYAPPQQYAQPPYAPTQPQPYAGAQQPGQGNYPGQPAPMGYPAGSASPELECRFCRSVPAANATFRGHQGMIIIMRFLSLKGPFCRDCGLATYRGMTSRTLVQGWWGIGSSIATPVTVLWNFIPRSKVASLPPPRPAAHGQSRHPMNPEPALLMRPMTIIGLALPALAVMLIFFSIVMQSI